MIPAPDAKRSRRDHEKATRKKIAARLEAARLNASKSTSRTSEMKSLEGKHKGKPCFILGCGYSVNLVDLSKLDKYVTIGVNRIVYSYFPTYWIFIDHPIVKEFGSKIDLKVIGSQIVCWEQARFTTHGAMVFHTHKNRRANILDPKSEGLQFGNTTSFAALHLAYLMGCNPIAFIGLDLCYVNGYLHFYDVDKQKLKESPFKDKAVSRSMVKREINGKVYWTRNDMMRMERNISAACKFLMAKGIDIYNCSEQSMLSVVPKKPLDYVLSKI